jgi:hypothetical protein
VDEELRKGASSQYQKETRRPQPRTPKKDVLWFATWFAGEVIDIGDGSLGAGQFQRPRTVLKLVFLMQAGIVAGAGLPHLPKDFKPALAQTPQSASVRFAPFSKSPPVFFSPAAKSR